MYLESRTARTLQSTTAVGAEELEGMERRKEETDRLKWKRETETNVDNIKKPSLDLANKIISV